MEYKPKEKYKQELELEALEFGTPKTFKKICCPSCKEQTPAVNININDKIAICGHCDAVFPFHQEIEGMLSPKKVKQELLRPEGIDVFEYGDDLEISMQQPVLALETLGLFLPMIAIFISIIAIKESASPIYLGISWLLSIAYFIHMVFRNRHKLYLNISPSHLSIERRPRKLIKDQRYANTDISQIYHKAHDFGYAIFAIVNSSEGQKHIKLVGNLSSRTKAQYLEQEIERHLGIEDRVVIEAQT